MSSIYSDYDTETEESESEREEKQARIDYKMVTFSLAGRAYGLDIMCVKEISKADRFTVVPNTPYFVEGVYNLRGEIIPIINMRKMFHLEELERKKGEVASILILRIEESIIGVIVDRIDNVVGLDSTTIQPRHPLFTDINMKYIHGVVEVQDKLFVILDADRIFGDEAAISEARHVPSSDLPETRDRPGAGKAGGMESAPSKKKTTESDQDFLFIRDTLATFAKFYVDETNEDWVRRRLPEWKGIRKSEKADIQLLVPGDAVRFLSTFYSPCTGTLWSAELRDGLLSLLGQEPRAAFKVWNPGTGRGAEAFSVTSALRLAYPEARIKVWACDNDLLAISAAPATTWNAAEIPAWLKQSGLLKEAAEGFQFIPSLKDLLYFEYHDIRHGSALPDLDIIVARDIISFYDTGEKAQLLDYFGERLATGGLLVLGANETVKSPGWRRVEGKQLTGYINEKS